VVPGIEGLPVAGNTLAEALANIKEAIELYLETLPVDERDLALSREILTTAVEVNV
jgi:predicted RNase H-like HicB family nuclease